MLDHFFVRTHVIARLRHGPLGPYLDDLATRLHHQGYAPSSIQSYVRTGEYVWPMAAPARLYRQHAGRHRLSTLCRQASPRVSVLCFVNTPHGRIKPGRLRGVYNARGRRSGSS